MPEDPLFGTCLFVCAKNWVLRHSGSLNAHETKSPEKGDSNREIPNSSPYTGLTSKKMASFMVIKGPNKSLIRKLVTLVTHLDF